MPNIQTEAIARAQSELSRLIDYKNSLPAGGGKLNEEDHNKDKKKTEAENIVQPILGYLKAETQSLTDEEWSVEFSQTYPHIIKPDEMTIDEEFLYSESSEEEMNDVNNSSLEKFSNVTAATCKISGTYSAQSLTISLIPIVEKRREYLGHKFLLKIERTWLFGAGDVISDQKEMIYAPDGVDRMREEIVRFITETEYMKLFMSAFPPM